MRTLSRRSHFNLFRTRHAKGAKQKQRRLLLESLEPRQMMAVVSIIAQGTAPEGTDQGYFRIARDALDSQPLTVHFTITGSATEGADYVDIGTSAVIPADALFIDIPIASNIDNEYEPLETIQLNLNTNPAYTIGSPGNAIMGILHCNGYANGPVAIPRTCPTCPPGPGDVVDSGTNNIVDPRRFPGIVRGDQGFQSIVRGDQEFQSLVRGDQEFQNLPVANPDPGAIPVSFPNGTIFGFSSSGYSSHPVRYADGVVMVYSNDLKSDGMGVPWGVTRSWTNAQAHFKQNVVGTRMLLSEQPYITNPGDNDFFVMSNSSTAREFTYDTFSGVFVPHEFAQETLVADATAGEFVLTDTEGSELRFYALLESYPEFQRGQFKSFKDAHGNTVSVVSHTTDGRIQEVQRSYTSGGTTITESYLYTHLTTLINNGLIDSVTLRRREGAGAWVTQRKVEYAYYGSGEANGNRGDLKTATIKDAANNVLGTTYYRYYKPGEANGFTHGLKYVLYPESYARFSLEVGDPLTATNTALAPYADHYFEYDSYLKVTKEIAQGAGCSACSGGQGTFTYAYADNTPGGGYNKWQRKTVETLPDGNQNIVYTNYRGQVMLQVFKDTTTSQEWATYTRFDNAGRVLFRADPSAVSGYSEAYDDLVHFDSVTSNYQYIRDTAGLVTNFSYYGGTTATDSTPGDVAGYLESISIQQGETGIPIPQSQQNYIARTAGSTTIYLPANSTVYANTNGTGGLTTSYVYSFFSGTVQIESQTTTDAAGGVDTIFFDTYGRPTWKKDPKGFLHYTAYDNQTGAITKTITDVNSSQTGDFTGKPSGWTTPTGGGLHLITIYEVDSLGRPTKSTDANGNITYVVYNDTNHEIRVYSGWNTSTNLPTGPTIVMREDRDRSYTEVLTMSATPNLTSGRPNGTEAISGLQSLSRTHTNDAGQVLYQDDYISFSGLTYTTSATFGTQNTHFLRTTNAYDTRGRHAKTVRPDGTIFRTVFDGQGRPVSEWVGDNDTPTSGFWSPTNPAGMIKVKEYQFDGGGVGDSLLTRLTDALGRQTTLAYDFRGRLTTTTLPDPDGGGGPLTSPIYTTAYDNLGRETSQIDPLGNVTTFAYNTTGRTTTITSPDPDAGGPATSPVTVLTYDAIGLLVSQTDPLSAATTYEFDGARRLKKVTQPDPDGAGSQTSPITQYSYDGVGNLRFVTDPLSHVTEHVYDKSNRRTSTIAPDPDGGGLLTSPVTAYAYDAAGRLLLTVTDPLSRVTTNEYDALGRLKKITQPDPDGGGPLAVPVTQFGYDAASRQTSVTDPLSNVTSYAYNFFDQLTTLTEADPDGAGSLTSPVTTYTYNAADEMLSQTDPLSRTTNYTYDGLGRRTKTTQPDPDGAGPLTRPETSYTYDAASNLKTVTDPLSHVTTYDYDNLYRRTKVTDALTGQTSFTYDAAGRMLTLKDPVNNTTTWQYDTLGRVTQETNQLNKTRTFKYDAASNVTERVDRLGRKIEYVYDNLDRSTAERWWNGSTLVRTLSFTFDAANQLTAASDPAASYGYTLDNLGRVTNETQNITGLTPQIQYQSQYDANSRRTQLQALLGGTADFKNTYLYDNLNRLTMLKQQSGGAGPGATVVAEKRADFAYNSAGQTTKVDRYADLSGFEHVVSTHYSYDGIGRLTKLLHTEGPTAPGSGWGTDALAGYQYVYDAASRFTSIDSFVDGLTTYTHDATSQLTGADHTGMTDEAYSYDANGNRTMSGYSTTANNQLTTDGVYNYTYDDEGNRLTRTKISNGKIEEYTWDHRNRLTKITFKNSDQTVTKTVDQYYDVFNRWVRRCVTPNGANDIDTFFSYEGGQVALQFDDGGAASDLAHRYLWAPAVDQLLADEAVTVLTSAGTMLWPFGDHLGTLRDLATYNTSTDDTAVASHRRYDSYGKLISETNAAVDEIFGFTGRALDESTGLQNNLNRWYDTTVGRWLTEDPIGFRGDQGNLSRYGENSPDQHTDPVGLWAPPRRSPPYGSYDCRTGRFYPQSGPDVPILLPPVLPPPIDLPFDGIEIETT
ncbi:MAG: hypothetical protein L0211_25085, partial [Planctomycetaceae bacterium]|nr:hypothetical protein [Planctomycetaceae bacterium]